MLHFSPEASVESPPDSAAQIHSAPQQDIAARIGAVAACAAEHADAVDRAAAFPSAAIALAKRNNLLARLVPTEFGGEGASVSDAAEICYALGQACASTAMIVAMHYSALSCVVRHSRGSRWHEDLLRHVAADNLLLASSTTEGNSGGNVRTSEAPLLRDNGFVTLERAATVISYGAEADGIVTTARYDAGSAGTDQALVVFLKKDYTLIRSRHWSTLGMRGTCSAGFVLEAAAPAEQVLPVRYDVIHPQTMVPVSHLVWSAVWAGIAAAAVARAQAFVRTAARGAGGRPPPGAAQYVKANASLCTLRDRLVTALARFESMRDDAERLGSLASQTALNLLKVEMSEGALATVSMAMRACGLAGYRDDGEFSLGRHLRDILSAPIMIHNERILANISTASLMSPIPSGLAAP